MAKVIAPELAFGAADIGVAAGAEAGLGAATDIFGAFSPEVFAAESADVAAGGLGAETAAAAVPDLSATAGLDTLNATFGTFNPELFAANTAATEIAPTGFDLGAGAVSGGGTFGGGLPAADSGFFTGTSGELFSGAGMGPAGGGFTSGPVQPFGDAFSTTDAFGNPVSASGQISDVGNFGGGVQAGGGAPAGGGFQAPIGSEATATESTTPMVTSDTGIVQSEPIQGGDSFASRFDASFQPDAPGTTPTTQSPLATDFSANFNPSNVEMPTLGQTAAPPIDQTLATATATPEAGGLMNAPQINQIVQTGLSGESAFGPLGGPVSTTGEMFAPLDTTTTAAATPATALPTATTVGPGVTGTPGVTAATPATATTPAAAGGGISPLTALRAGTLGVNAITAGINLNNALNQPSYPALQPTAYPGSIYSPYYSSSQPGAPGTGGIAGGLAANRLTNALVSGATPQQLEASGLIGQGRATRLQSTYSGISAQYAKQLGVSEQSLSPGVKRMIAAQALADMNLGGR